MTFGEVIMAQSQTGFVDSTRGGGAAPASAGQADQAVGFRFAVTWGCLSIPATPPSFQSDHVPAILSERPRGRTASTSPHMMPSAPTLSTPVVLETPHASTPSPGTAIMTTPKTPPTAPKKSAPGGGFQWEMVVPKMVRTGRKANPRSGRGGVGQGAPVEQTPPNLYTASSSFRKSSSLKLCAGVLAAAAIVIPVWWHAARPASNTVQTTIEGGDWLRQAAVGGDPGVKQARQLVLYRPALKAKDSRLEFAWTVASGDLGLVFRAKDLGNYYAVRLKVLKAGPTPTLAAEFFSVYQFVESAHTEKVLVFSRNDPVYLVRLDVFGPTFTLYLQDNATDFWTDARMTSGALGFFEEWNRTAEVRGLRMSFPQRSQLLRGPWGEMRARNTVLGGD
jgi:hypothetical protein